MKFAHHVWQFGTISLLWLTTNSVGWAQIVPDGTLPNNSVVIPTGNNLQIEGGTKAGRNLFHSFAEFSIPTGNSAIFNNTPEIQNIFSRVTGGKISNIDGLINANGGANLFLLNPNGIIFGPNAQLNIGGSFISSTANSIRFADGSTFSALASTATPLLTISVPIGLQFGSNPGGQIQVQGSNMAVQTGKTLALLGGDLIISGSTNPFATGLTAGGIPLAIVNGNPVPTTPGGRIELWSVINGQLSIENVNGKVSFGNAQDNTEFANIQLSNAARIDTSGTGGGEINIQARNLQLTTGARLSSFTLGDVNGGAIAVNASESIEIIGTGGYEETVLRFVTGNLSPNDLKNGFFSLTFGAGAAGHITINTPVFVARNGAYIAASTFGGEGGNIIVNAPNSVELSAAFIATGTGIGNAKNAGNLTINTSRFMARDNGILTTSSFGTGRGGDVNLNATESVEIISSNLIPIPPEAKAFGGIFTSGLGVGDAGALNLFTRRLILRNGAGLAASSFGEGDGGNITIKASESVELIGSSPDGQLLSSITSVTEPNSTGKGGQLWVETNRIILRDGGRISIRARGTGDAGNLIAIANSILMDNQGGLEGTSESGIGGNFTVRSHHIQMRRNSFISATAGNEGGAGNGGNITIDTDTLATLENSDITANSVASQGGNVSINAQAIFQTPDSNITATGGTPALRGTVQIKTPEINTAASLVELPENFADVRNQITTNCAAAINNRFVIIGRGGLPPDPTQLLRGQAIWRDMERLSVVRDPSAMERKPQKPPLTPDSPQIIEATGWIINAKGEVELIANASNVTHVNPWDVIVNCRD